MRDSTEAKRCQGCNTEYYSTHPTECDECIEHEARERLGWARLPANTPIHLSERTWKCIADVIRWHLGGDELPNWFKPTELDLEKAKDFVSHVDALFAKGDGEKPDVFEEWEDAQ